MGANHHRGCRAWRSKRGSIAVSVLAIIVVVLELCTVTLLMTSSGIQRVTREESRIACLHLAEAGIQEVAGQIWNSFKVSQSFDQIDSQSVPFNTITRNLGSQQCYQASVTTVNNVDSYTRDLVIVSVGWTDTDGDVVLDTDEPRRAIRALVRFSLSRSAIFDYAYFVNNYGWMNGFSSTQLIVNGDMRANGNFDFSGGTPTINGSVYAAPNSRLIPPAEGVVNITPNQWTNTYYETNASSRARQAYNSTKHGDIGSDQFKQWCDIIYSHDASIVNENVFGAVVGDKNGIKTYGGTVLDPEPMHTLPMPDLSDISRYQTLSNNYVDTKATFADGTPNPNYNQGAYLEVWDSGTGSYQRISTNGVVTGSAVVIGTFEHPVKVHGPVTVTQDVIIKGNIQGQGTIYAGRNVHIVGSIIYQDPPDFRGSDPEAIDNANEKKSILGLAASASIIMGDTSTFGKYPLQYMTPPFTKPRYDDNGNYIPAFDANAIDSYGVKKYRSLLGDAYIHSVASPISQIDAVLYTNFLGGGNIGTGGGGVTFNGSIISKDEAMVLYSLPFRMNYDNRIKERSLGGKPLIDINLPRTPSVVQLNWQEILT